MGLDKEDIKQLIQILQKGLVDDNDEIDEPVREIKKDPIKTKKSSKFNNNRENKFIEMGFASLHKEDIEIDRALSKHPPTPRRSKFKPLNVVCRSCGKKESINPAILNDSPERYKCNTCCTSAG